MSGYGIFCDNVYPDLTASNTLEGSVYRIGGRPGQFQQCIMFTRNLMNIFSVEVGIHVMNGTVTDKHNSNLGSITAWKRNIDLLYAARTDIHNSRCCLFDLKLFSEEGIDSLLDLGGLWGMMTAPLSFCRGRKNRVFHI